MAPEKSPAFQFYPKDFLSDEHQGTMTLPEVGAYIRLLSRCWLEGSLPNDIEKLGRLCGASKFQMKQMWRAIEPCFCIREHDHRLIHPRLEKERDKQESYRRRQSDKGKLSANQRAAKPPPDFNHGSTTVQPERQPEPNSPISCLPSPVSDLQTPVRESVRAPLALAGSLPRDHVRHGWCSSRGKCVPDFLHEEFLRSVGGERQAADQRLRVFYEAREHGWPEGPIGDDPVKLWRREFAASFPSVAPVNGAPDRTAMLRKATAEFLK